MIVVCITSVLVDQITFFNSTLASCVKILNALTFSVLKSIKKSKSTTPIKPKTLYINGY